MGEGAVFFVLSREKLEDQAVMLAGYGESSDAYHMTAPHPTGAGAAAAMEAAFSNGGINLSDIAYVNLHGTGTVLNDKAESLAMYAVFGDTQPPASSTKPVTGHTLGAAGALEAAICWMVLTEKKGLPAHCWDGVIDEEIQGLESQISLIGKNCMETPAICMSNSFAFGGCNVSLILGRK